VDAEAACESPVETVASMGTGFATEAFDVSWAPAGTRDNAEQRQSQAVSRKYRVIESGRTEGENWKRIDREGTVGNDKRDHPR
jgi:hypothetical protein